MKKIYILAITMIAFTFTANAQFNTIDFEGFNTTDDIASQSGLFRNWSGPSGTGEDGFVVDTQGNPSQSLLIGGNETSDVVLLLGELDGGEYTLQFDYFVVDGATGFYGILASSDVSSPIFPLAFRPNNGGSGDNFWTDDANTIVGEVPEFTYGEWHTMSHFINLDDNEAVVTMDGTTVIYDGLFDSNLMGAVDLWSINSDCENYFDNIVLVEGELLSTDDVSNAFFSVYPNPVNDILNIDSNSKTVDSVTIYDVIGKIVLQEQPSTISPKINMSTLSSGAYFVKVVIGKSIGTIKIVK